MEKALLELLCCPHDHADLETTGDGLDCLECGRHYPIKDEVVCFLESEQLTNTERKEQESRDQESTWYDTMFEGYTNAVEVPTAIRRIGHPKGPILDHGAGTGRITSALTELGQPVVAMDYSIESLRKLVDRCAGCPVLAVQADLRSLPVKDASVDAVTSIEVHMHVRARESRIRELEELSRVMAPGAPLSISTLNYNLVFKAWTLLGNKGAREGEHLLGGDFYYLRMTRQEFLDELTEVFDVDELTGIRNIPARSLAGFVRKAGFDGTADRLLGWMVRTGHKLDFAIEKTPLAGHLGFFWLAKARRRA